MAVRISIYPAAILEFSQPVERTQKQQVVVAVVVCQFNLSRITEEENEAWKVYWQAEIFKQSLAYTNESPLPVSGETFGDDDYDNDEAPN